MPKSIVPITSNGGSPLAAGCPCEIKNCPGVDSMENHPPSSLSDEPAALFGNFITVMPILVQSFQIIALIPIQAFQHEHPRVE